MAVDPSSSLLVGALNHVVAVEGPKNGLNINTTAWSVPIYTVPAGQPLVRVLLVKGTNASTNPLQSAWNSVPLPANAVPAKGTDKHLVIWQPSTDKMWEFWGFEYGSTGAPQAQWGGAMENVQQNAGVYNTSAWQRPIANAAAWEADVNSWGASATSLPVVAGLITLEDLQRGRIDHALAIAVPNTRATVYASPAQRTDGNSSEPSALPEGAHLRLDPNLDLAALHLPHIVLMLAEAAQRYGIVVRDRSANITFYAEDPTPTGTNPYTGPKGYFEGQYAYKFLTTFPWSHLELLQMQLHN